MSKKGDFFSTSQVRDLIFNYQEHRFNLIQISKIIKEFNLEFLGFIYPNLKKQYSNSFPNDKKNILLKNWHKFEVDNPNSFSKMYRFWVKKK